MGTPWDSNGLLGTARVFWDSTGIFETPGDPYALLGDSMGHVGTHDGFLILIGTPWGSWGTPQDSWILLVTPRESWGILETPGDSMGFLGNLQDSSGQLGTPDDSLGTSLDS